MWNEKDQTFADVIIHVDMNDGKGVQYVKVSIDKERMALGCGDGELAKYGGRYVAAEIEPYLDEIFSVRYPDKDRRVNESGDNCSTVKFVRKGLPESALKMLAKDYS